MNFYTFAVLAVVLAMGSAQKYTSRFDNIDVDMILKNDRILTNYIKCLLEKGPCTNEGRELKKTLPDAIATDCTKCSPTQKEQSNKVIQFLRDRKPQEWIKLTEKYDPQGNFRRKYEGKQL